MNDNIFDLTDEELDALDTEELVIIEAALEVVASTSVQMIVENYPAIPNEVIWYKKFGNVTIIAFNTGALPGSEHKAEFEPSNVVTNQLAAAIHKKYEIPEEEILDLTGWKNLSKAGGPVTVNQFAVVDHNGDIRESM